MKYTCYIWTIIPIIIINTIFDLCFNCWPWLHKHIFRRYKLIKFISYKCSKKVSNNIILISKTSFCNIHNHSQTIWLTPIWNSRNSVTKSYITTRIYSLDRFITLKNFMTIRKSKINSTTINMIILSSFTPRINIKSNWKINKSRFLGWIKGGYRIFTTIRIWGACLLSLSFLS